MAAGTDKWTGMLANYHFSCSINGIALLYKEHSQTTILRAVAGEDGRIKHQYLAVITSEPTSLIRIIKTSDAAPAVIYIYDPAVDIFVKEDERNHIIDENNHYPSDEDDIDEDGGTLPQS